MEKKILISAISALCLLLSLCCAASEACGAGAAFPVSVKTSTSKAPYFYDDLTFPTLEKAINESLDYLGRIPADRRFHFCGEKYSAAWLEESLRSFAQLMKRATEPRKLGALINKHFDICQVMGDSGSGRVLVTGYFEPILEASLSKESPYLYPLYSTPPDLTYHNGGAGRWDGDSFVPYWSRAEINKGNILAGNELVYLASPIDNFILHVQGSGQVRLPDKSVRRIQYAAKNGRRYRSIGRYLVDRGKMDLEEASLPKIRRYLEEHPAELRDILNHNESFIFFKWGEHAENGPKGCLGEELTAGRSIALDQAYYPSGVLAFLQTRKPLINARGEIMGWEPFSRFVLNQDSGSAIKGGGRVDLYWGSGMMAEAAAGVMKHPGKLYVLLLKKK